MTTVKFNYKNYKGEVRLREVEVKSLDWLVSPGFDYQPGWFLTGIDVEKDVIRSFALTHIVLDNESSASLLMRIPL